MSNNNLRKHKGRSISLLDIIKIIVIIAVVILVVIALIKVAVFVLNTLIDMGINLFHPEIMFH